jgi:hypothetical protein
MNITQINIMKVKDLTKIKSDDPVYTNHDNQ